MFYGDYCCWKYCRFFYYNVIDVNLIDGWYKINRLVVEDIRGRDRKKIIWVCFFDRDLGVEWSF